MADNKKRYKYIHLKNRTKRQQLITPSTSLSSLYGESSGSVNAADTGAAAGTASPSSTSSFRKSFKMGKKAIDKDKQKHGNGPPKERWLLTRKTWKYMTDAGRRLIPEYMQNRHHNSQDLKQIEEYFQHVCRSEPKFLPWRRKQSYPGALGTSPFRRSGKMRHTSKWFGRSSSGLSPISDNKSSGSSNISSPATKANSADESEDDLYTGNESQRMFLIIEMLEKYLKLSNTSPTGNADEDDIGNAEQLKESSSSPNDYNSSPATSPPIRSATSPPTTTAETSYYNIVRGEVEVDGGKQTSLSPPPYYGYRSSESEARRKFLFDVPANLSSPSTTTAAATTSSASATKTSIGVPGTSGDYISRAPSTSYTSRTSGNAHTSLLLENLRNYGRSNRSSLLSSMNFTPAMLEDKQLLRRIRDEIKQQQLDSILRRHSRRPFSADTNTMRLSTSLFTLPTLKSSPPLNILTEQNEATNASASNALHSTAVSASASASSDRNITNILTSYDGNQTRTQTIDEPCTSPTGRVPLISIKLASQERISQSNVEGTQTDPIPVNLIYQQYNEYVKRVEREHAEQQQLQQQQQKANALGKSMSQGSKIGGANAGKHSKRKSSIDNEDVSQSVSDTIKRYLRMARKKPANDNDANRFKRINYDTNLRNIVPKAEIPKPDELQLDGNTKFTQTNDNWCEVVISEIKAHMSNKDIPITDFPADFLQHPSPSTSPGRPMATMGDTKPMFMSSSMPSSPTGFFHTSNKSSAKRDDGGDANASKGNTTFNMQKSKSSTNVGQVFSKKIWKSRSKSQTRPDSPAQQAHWMPQGNCSWKSVNGKYLQLQKTHLQELTDVERKTLQRIALDRINQLNIGVPIKPPSDASGTDALQAKSQKRRAPLLLKRKALTTGFFDSNKIKSDGRKGSTSGSTHSGGGLIFGQPLEKCLSNDNAMSSLLKGKAADDSAKFSRNSRSSITSLDAQLPVGSGLSSDGTYTGSCDSLFSKHDMRFIGSNSGDSLSDTGGYASTNLDEDELLGIKSPSGTMRTTQQQVPPIINACIDHLTMYGLNVVGIFRVSTSKRRIRELREELDSGSMISFDSETSPHDVASLLKEYLRDLPEPLLCRSLYPAFLSTQKIRNRRLQLEALSHLIQLLPVAHRDTLYVLLKFLAHVARCSDDVMNLSNNTCISVGNKMDSANLATVIAPNILHSNKDASAIVASEEEAEERLDVINVVRTMIDHYEELFAVPADVMDDVYTVMMDSYPQQLDYLFDRKQSQDRRDGEHDRDSTSKSPAAAQLHTHFFPQQDRPDGNNDVGMDESSDQPRRMYVREEFTHENAVRGNLSELNDGSIKRRERGSRNKNLTPEHDTFFSRRRRREKLPSSSSNNSSPSAEDNVSYSYAVLNVSPPTSPTYKSPEYKSNSNEVLMASLKLPVQILNATSATSTETPSTALNLSSDMTDIPYIEDVDSPTSNPPIVPLRQSKSVSQANQLVKKCAFPLTKLKSQYKSQQMPALSTADSASPTSRSQSDSRRNSGVADGSVDKNASQPSSTLSSGIQKPKSVKTASIFSTEPKLTASITSIGGDVMRSKTAEFERMLMQQNKRNSKSNSIDSGIHRRNDTKQLPSITSRAPSTNLQSSRNSSDILATSAANSKSGGSDTTPNVGTRNGPIYKRRDVISSALNMKK